MTAQPCLHCARTRRAISACWLAMHSAADLAESEGATIEATVIRDIVNAMAGAAENYLAAQKNTEGGEPLAPSSLTPEFTPNTEDAMT